MKSWIGYALAIASLAIGSYNIAQLVTPPEPVTARPPQAPDEIGGSKVLQSGGNGTIVVAQDIH